MTMETNLQGRLHNTSLPLSNGLLPLFEAVSNSLHAIEEAGLSATGSQISIEIIRIPQAEFTFDTDHKRHGPETKDDIIGFKVTDNGIGFTDDNINSFITLDSLYKADKGGRGVGRLLWLKAFKRANITSVYEDKEGLLKKRTFFFNSTQGVYDQAIEDAVEFKTITCVHLDGFEKKYRESSPKTAKVIANHLLEHCLWYFVRPGGAPIITIVDGEESIDLDDVCEQYMLSSTVSESITIKGINFELIHIKGRAQSSRTHMLAFCAANRLVKEESIRGKIPGLFGSLSDESGDFLYTCYVSSLFLDENVRSERTGFDIAEEMPDLLLDSELSLKDIRECILARAAEYLKPYLDENIKKGLERVEDFVSRKAPRYRSLLSRMPVDMLHVDPNISDKELHMQLHKGYAEVENKLLADGNDIMNPKDDESTMEYRARVDEYLGAVSDFKKSDLASYVSHRKVILDILEIAIRKNNEGKYEREDMIHNLIMPMGKDSTEVELDNCNLWLIDERLAFHNYLASDKSIAAMPITGSEEGKRPDICALNTFDKPVLVAEGEKLPLASIVVVELKRPMRGDAAEGEQKNPIEQVLGYLKRIRSGQVLTASGRPIPMSESIPGYCYVICDLTPAMMHRFEVYGMTMTSDGLGFFTYNKNFEAYVEVISFDRLVNAAKERNRAFFDKLGLPTT